MPRSSDIVRGGAWTVGRAGMLYRDLLPGGLGGRFVASHIRIPDAGPVPDWVHFHSVAFQVIYCHAGWFRVVYEDQGPPFVMRAGEAVLQPPTIRHRVLECSAGAEVVEVTAPAAHATHADPELTLPTATVCRDRLWHGQRFSFSQGGSDIATASGGRVRVDRLTTPTTVRHDSALCLWFVRSGAATLDGERLSATDAVSVPPATEVRLEGDAEVVQIRVEPPR